MSVLRGVNTDDIVVRKLDGPPPPGFDCGREMQNAFLYERAWSDQDERLSVTYAYFVAGIFAAYATVCMDSLELGTREKRFKVRYRFVGAVKIAQLGVDRRFQGMGLGKLVVADMIAFAQDQAARIGCRYVSLDAQVDLAMWYEAQGFKRNKLMQRSPHSVSMRFDLGGRRP